MEIPAGEIDWRALRVQKILLLRVGETNPYITENEGQALLGLVNLLDLIQDTAVEQGEAPDTDVFTHRELRSQGYPNEDMNLAPWVLVGETDKDWLDAFMYQKDAEIQAEMLERDYSIAARVISGEQYRKAAGIKGGK